jgi:hypothetical protein
MVINSAILLKDKYIRISFKNMGKHADSTDSKILRRIRSRKRGWVFTPDTFMDLGTRQAVDLALMRHRDSGLIRQLARGLYDYPKIDPQLGMLQPSTDDIASALAGRDATRLQPSGAYAANLLGLSTQVPMKVVYLTDGRTRTVQIGKRQIILKHTTPRNMATAGRISGLVIQALRHIGRKSVDQQVITRLGRRLDTDARKQLIKDIRYAPAWIADTIRVLSDQESTA